MTRHHARTSRTLSRRGWTPYLVVVAGVCLAMLSPGLTAHAADPAVPADLEVPAGHTLFLRGRAIGTQNYLCLPTDSGLGWVLFGPQATLFNFGRQIITHFLSPNPDEEDLPRATWQHSRDTSSVWAMAIGSSSDPDFVRPGAIPGCCSRWWERSPVLAGGPGLPRPPLSSGYAPREAWRRKPAVTRLQTSERELSCLTEPSTSSISRCSSSTVPARAPTQPAGMTRWSPQRRTGTELLSTISRVRSVKAGFVHETPMSHSSHRRRASERSPGASAENAGGISGAALRQVEWGPEPRIAWLSRWTSKPAGAGTKNWLTAQARRSLIFHARSQERA